MFVLTCKIGYESIVSYNPRFMEKDFMVFSLDGFAVLKDVCGNFIGLGDDYIFLLNFSNVFLIFTYFAFR